MGNVFKAIINIRKTNNGKYVYEVKLSPTKKNSSFSSQPGETQRQPARQEPLHRSSENKVSQPVDSVKTQHSEHDNSVSDRELLREAAGHAADDPAGAAHRAGEPRRGKADVRRFLLTT